MFHHAAAAFSRAERIRIAGLPGPAPAPAAPRGLMAGTLVETALGWRPVEALAPGDGVQTRDGGLRPVLRVERRRFAGPRGPAGLRGLLRVPGGALMNCAPFLLLPGQHLMFETPYAEAVFGTPFTLVPGRALAGHRGIAPMRPAGPAEAVVLRFAEEELVWCNTGILAHCPGLDEAPGGAGSAHFPVLAPAQAEALLGLIEIGATGSDELGRTDEPALALA